MQKLLKFNKLRFERMKGVGTMELDFLPEKQVYTLIGENGIGKTKFLESLFSVLLFSNKTVYDEKVRREEKDNIDIIKHILFKTFCNDENLYMRFPYYESDNLKNNIVCSKELLHNLPIAYISAQHRGEIKNQETNTKFGNRKQRKHQYIDYLLNCFNDNPENLRHLNTDTNIEEWIIQRAQSANPFQAKEDNREIEVTTLLQLLHSIDSRIDEKHLEISGSNRVFIKIENQKRELSELSSGFTSILKILQSIISSYSYFTNETDLRNVRGFVLIDEIESHLHHQWQVKIVPLLKELFPNTTFYITTHSSLIISQLNHGEAYRLQRKKDGVVYGEIIDYPRNLPLIDLLNDAFDINLNQLKYDSLNKDNQKEAKQALLSLVKNALTDLEKK